MPNHVQNVFVEVSNTTKFNKIARNKEGSIDFSILIPVPFTLNIASCGEAPQTEYDKIQKIEAKVTKEPFYNSLNNVIEECLKEDIKITTILQYYNKKHYGVLDWYKYQIDKWGTKWNAYETEEDSMEFQTAWSTPEEWLRELAKHIDFKLIYADEDIGNNLGFIEAFEGELTLEEMSGEEYSDALAYLIRGYDDYIDQQIEFAEDNEEVTTDEEKEQLRTFHREKLEQAHMVLDTFKKYGNK